MITFIICVKHYENCHSYDNTWELLKNTLISVCNQTDENFDVIVVSNKTLDDFVDNPKIKNVKFIEVDWEPPAPSDGWQIGKQINGLGGMKQIRLDRGTKYILGLSEVKKKKCKQNHYVMFVDADDFIHKALAKYVNNSNKAFLKVDKGIRLGIKNTFEYLNSFSSRCGTSNITKLEMLKQEIDFNGVDVNSPQNQIIKTTTDFYLKMIIGSHGKSFGYFTELGYKGGTIPFHAAVYNCSHNEQHSGKSNLPLSKNKCSDDMIKDFSIPLDTNLEIF